MYADITKPPASLPTPRSTALSPGVTLLPPLSRQGYGPGLLILGLESNVTLDIKDGVPSTLIKWAEEGYTVVALSESSLKAESADIDQLLGECVKGLKLCEECEPKEKVGLVAYDPNLFSLIATYLSGFSSIAGVVIYTDSTDVSAISNLSVPALRHIACKKPDGANAQVGTTEHYYPNTSSHLFATPFQPHFNYTIEAVSHTRNLTFLKKLMGGPHFDLEAIWEEHTYYEFADRSVEHTMSTMVAEPYVNHVPTLTGGIGRIPLTDFYQRHFIFNNSADTSLDLISRTVGIDRIVDEFIFSFTHDQEVDWIFPGIPPTHKKVELPFVAIVNVRGDRLYHEHISWDQGSALRQLGLLPEYLPFPHQLADGRKAAEGKEFYYRLPVAGLEAAEKMKNRGNVKSNEMFEYRIIEN